MAVGKIKEKYFTDAINEYKKRLSKFCDYNIIEVDEYKNTKTSPEEIKKTITHEGENILAKLKGYVVAMAIQGKMLSSEELADTIKNQMVQGISEITFVIGGSNGLSKEVLSRADMLISFGKVTYPHQLMRVILTEQIYRAFCINNSVPYHK